MFLTQGLFWGCGRGVSQGYTRLKAYLAWKMFLSSFSWLLAGSLSSWPFSVCSQGSPQHVSWSDSLPRESDSRDRKRETLYCFYDLISKSHTTILLSSFHQKWIRKPSSHTTGEDYIRVWIAGGKGWPGPLWRLATTVTEGMDTSCLSLTYFPLRALYFFPVITDLTSLLLKCAQECKCKAIINL